MKIGVEKGTHWLCCPGSNLAQLFFTVLNLLLEFIVRHILMWR